MAKRHEVGKAVTSTRSTTMGTHMMVNANRCLAVAERSGPLLSSFFVLALIVR